MICLPRPRAGVILPSVCPRGWRYCDGPLRANPPEDSPRTGIQRGKIKKSTPWPVTSSPPPPTSKGRPVTSPPANHPKTRPRSSFRFEETAGGPPVKTEARESRTQRWRGSIRVKVKLEMPRNARRDLNRLALRVAPEQFFQKIGCWRNPSLQPPPPPHPQLAAHWIVANTRD